MKLIADDIDLTEYLKEPDDAHKIRPAGSWLSEVTDIFHRPRDTPKIGLGFQKTYMDFEMRPEEVSLWAGINGHGKSQFVGQVGLNLCQQHQRVCIASLEMPPKRTMARLSRQASGTDLPSIQFLKDFHRWTDDKLWIYDHVGKSDPKTMGAIIRYSVDKFGIQHFVIDNLTKVIDGDDNYNAQKDFVNMLCNVAHDTGVHIHLVAHVRKGKSETDQPGKFDVKGAGAITDLVDNVFIVWRNKGKEEAERTGDNYDPTQPDCVLQIEKQRNGETEGKYGFWFDHESLQYLETKGDVPKCLQVKEREVVNLEEAF